MTPEETLSRALVAAGEADSRIVVYDADVAATAEGAGFREAFPDRFYEMGLAPANLIGAAAGMAATGEFVPLLIGMAGRLTEVGGRVAAALAAPRRHVKMLAVYEPGRADRVKASAEDLTALRAIPGVAVVDAAGVTDAQRLLPAVLAWDGPVYLRVPSCGGEPEGFDYKPVLGQAAPFREGDEVTLLGSGLGVLAVLRAGEKLAADGVSTRVAHMHTVQPLDAACVEQAARQTLGIVAVEVAGPVPALAAAVATRVAADFSCLVRSVTPSEADLGLPGDALVERLAERTAVEARYILENA